MKKIIAIYVRESTREQAQNGYNLDGQIRNCKKYLEGVYKKGTYEVVIYKEDGYSSLTLKRPKLAELLKDIVNGKIDDICIYDILRLIRKLEHWFVLKPLFEKHNVSVKCVSREIDTSSPEGKFRLYLDLALGELEQDRIGKRTKEGLLEGAMQGYFVKGGKTSFGFERVYEKSSASNKKRPKLVVVDEERKVLRKMRDYLLKGFSVYSISIMLRSDPYLKKNEKVFNENQVARMLTDVLYTGVMVLQDKEFKLDMDVIFTADEIEEHKKLMSVREKTTKYSFLFNRKVFTCRGDFATNASAKSGQALYYYDRHTKNRINEKWVLNEVLDYLQANEVLYKKKRNIAYESDIRKLNKKRDSIVVMYKCRHIDWCTYSSELKKVDNEIKRVRKAYTDFVECFHTYFDDLKYEEKQVLINEHISRIDVDFILKKVVNIE